MILINVIQSYKLIISTHQLVFKTFETTSISNSKETGFVSMSSMPASLHFRTKSVPEFPETPKMLSAWLDGWISLIAVAHWYPSITGISQSIKISLMS